MYDGTASIDMGALLSGSNAPAVSFAAPNVALPDKVQFIVKTPDLHIEEEEKAPPKEEKKNFFQKLIALFSVKR